MLIYIASFAGLLSVVVLAVVYLADRYEREPIELIQNCFFFGFSVQLVLVIAASMVFGQLLWNDWWLLLTVLSAAVSVPLFLEDQSEMDEAFDGIVYAVAFLAGATCVIHLNNLPQVAADSPFRTAIESGANPGLRDLVIVDTSPVFAAELGQGLVVLLVGVLVGAVLGRLHIRGAEVGKIILACAAIGCAVMAVDVVTQGAIFVRGGVLAAAVFGAITAKRQSTFRNRPEPLERQALVMAVKTVLMVFGAALLATALLQHLAAPGAEPSDLETGSARPPSGMESRS